MPSGNAEMHNRKSYGNSQASSDDRLRGRVLDGFHVADQMVKRDEKTIGHVIAQLQAERGEFITCLCDYLAPSSFALVCRNRPVSPARCRDSRPSDVPFIMSRVCPRCPVILLLSNGSKRTKRGHNFTSGPDEKFPMTASFEPGLVRD